MRNSMASGTGCIMMIIMLVLYFGIGTFCNIYISEYWLTYINKENKFIHVPVKWCVLASVIGVASAPIAIVTKIVSYGIDNPIYDQCYNSKSECHYSK